MKYIVFEHELTPGVKQEVPVIFPLDLPHADVAAVMQVLLKGPSKRVVSAGEVIFDSAPRCFGNSTSLDKQSRGHVDGSLCYFHDIKHGLTDDRKDKSPNNG